MQPRPTDPSGEQVHPRSNRSAGKDSSIFIDMHGRSGSRHPTSHARLLQQTENNITGRQHGISTSCKKLPAKDHGNSNKGAREAFKINSNHSPAANHQKRIQDSGHSHYQQQKLITSARRDHQQAPAEAETSSANKWSSNAAPTDPASTTFDHSIVQQWEPTYKASANITADNISHHLLHLTQQHISIEQHNGLSSSVSQSSSTKLKAAPSPLHKPAKK
ncbi:hypothetical protein Nepgr_014723 [Nepenthes gracilis]|uniref:Uncharacterized protein n=1 Tax=Nepenthes gracilis TaxID=150966 RepID=A0AAD3XPR9_NEPGR|nr:hypothetical protein Nepgr_014723 [Nepenthes gracilis]